MPPILPAEPSPTYRATRVFGYSVATGTCYASALAAAVEGRGTAATLIGAGFLGLAWRMAMDAVALRRPPGQSAPDDTPAPPSA